LRYGELKFVDNGDFLFKHENRLAFYQFDLATMSLIELSLVEFDRRLIDGQIYLDQLDKRRFIIHNYDFLIGRIENNQIVLDAVSSLDMDDFNSCKLVGNQFCGLGRIGAKWHYIEVNLETKVRQAVKVPTFLNNGILIGLGRVSFSS
jgi:hypothetical protein